MILLFSILDRKPKGKEPMLDGNNEPTFEGKLGGRNRPGEHDTNPQYYGYVKDSANQGTPGNAKGPPQPKLKQGRLNNNAFSSFRGEGEDDGFSYRQYGEGEDGPDGVNR